MRALNLGGKYVESVSRTELLLGHDNMEKLKNARVAGFWK